MMHVLDAAGVDHEDSRICDAYAYVAHVLDAAGVDHEDSRL